jgi:hypothetical protein
MYQVRIKRPRRRGNGVVKLDLRTPSGRVLPF